MRVHITEPNYKGAFDSLPYFLRRRWIDLGPTIFYNPAPYEIHGDLLTRIWQQIFRSEKAPDLQEEDGLYLISESDFVIDPDFYAELKRWPWPGVKAILVPYTTRDMRYNVVHHGFQKPEDRLSGGWFIALNLSSRGPGRSWPRLDWLRADGPRNDAANLAYHYAIGDGFLKPEEVAWLEPEDLYPDAGFCGLRYDFKKQCVGTHCFFAREFLSHSSTLLLPHAPGVEPYLLANHLKHIEELLKHG